MSDKQPIRIILNLKDAFEWQMKLPKFLEYQLSIHDLQVSCKRISQDSSERIEVGIKGFSDMAAEEIKGFLALRFHGAKIETNCVDHWMDRFSTEVIPAFKVIRQPV